MNDLRSRAEEVARNISTAELKEISAWDKNKLIQEIQVHQIELEMQTEELTRISDELQKANDKYARFFDLAPVGYLKLDERRMSIVEVNSVMEQFIGVERHHLFELNFAQFVSSENVKDCLIFFKKIFETRQKHTCELYLKPKNKVPFYVRLEGVEIEESPGADRACLLFVINIDDHKKAHDELDRVLYKHTADLDSSLKVTNLAEANTLALVETTKDAIWSVDRDLRLVTFNTSFALNSFKAYGLLVSVGMHLSELLSKDMYESIRIPYERTLQGERVSFELQVIEGDREICREISLSPITSQGNITGIVGIGRDITKRKRNEEALKQSQADIAAIIENTNDLIWSVDREYKLITFNNNFSKFMFDLYGIHITPGMYPFNADSPQDSEKWRKIYNRALAAERYSFEMGYTVNGKQRYAEISLNTILTDGKVTGAVAFSRDITERKSDELALKTSKANIAALIENTEDSYWSVDRGYRLITMNTIYSDVYYKEMGIRLKPGDFPHENLTPEAAGYWIGLYDRCFTGENINFDFEFEVEKELRYFNISLHPIICDGETTGSACVSRDITQRKKSEEKMREHSALLDIANEAIFIRDLNANVIYWNKAAEKLYGWTIEEAIGRSTVELIHNKETIEKFREAWDELLFSGQWSGELQQRDKNGKEIIAYCRWTLVFDHDGQPTSVLSIHSDITEQKSLQQQFYRSQRLESLGTLASGIAHDLNNVLTPILLSVEILRIKYPEEKHAKMLETIEVSAQRGAGIVKQVLIFASGISGAREPLSLADSIREIEMIIRKTFSKSIDLNVNIADTAHILGDSTQIQQVLMNLCVNARDAMPGGGVLRIELAGRTPTGELFSTTPEAKSVGYSVLKISDSGTGIPDEIKEKIFDPFFTTKEIGKGTGLGLSTVNAIVKSHNGFLKVYNNEDKGTTFEIWLPSLHKKDAHIAAHEGGGIVVAGEGRTILVVDDEPLILQIISYTLNKCGFTVLTAKNGLEALLVFKEYPEIELVITDINMPEMDGPALIAELLLIRPDLKFVIMTGLPINNTMEEMKTIGVSSILSKPFKTEILLRAIDNAFNPVITTISN